MVVVYEISKAIYILAVQASRSLHDDGYGEGVQGRREAE
jgi:hypothetical protein